MNRRVMVYIISLLLAFAFMMPLIFHRDGKSQVVLNDRTAWLTVVRGVPLLAVLLVLTLTGSGQERKKWGWSTPLPADLKWAVLLFSATAFIGFLLPQDPPAFTIEITSDWKLVLIPLLSLFAAATEELFFRSWIIGNFEGPGGKGWPGVILSALLFGMMHVWQGYSAVALAFTAGLIYGVVFLLRRNLFSLIAAHTAHNILAMVLASRL